MGVLLRVGSGVLGDHPVVYAPLLSCSLAVPTLMVYLRITCLYKVLLEISLRGLLASLMASDVSP